MVPSASLVALVLHSALLSASLVSCGDEGTPYYCLEDYLPIGQLLRSVPLALPTPTQQQGSAVHAGNATAGQVARQCAAACDAQTDCSAFRAVGPPGLDAPQCQLLAKTAASLPSALALPAGKAWPTVLANVTAANSLDLSSVSWLCLKHVEDWDRLGLATNALVHGGTADPSAAPAGGRTKWCAFGVDVAGTNLQQITAGADTPAQCDDFCAATTGCTIWGWVAAQPTSGQAPHNCFVKADPFRGQNGWTGKPKSDIWIPDSQVHCFSNQQDWRHLGQVLSPAVKTIEFNSTYYTVYPERVSWAQAQATCAALPGGSLAVLASRAALDSINRQLLQTLASQTAVRSAWVGATGNNTLYNPNAAAAEQGLTASTPTEQVQQLGQRVVRSRQVENGSETTLTWLNGSPVAPELLRRLTNLPSIWTVHDVIWQYVPSTARGVCGRVVVQIPPPSGAIDPVAVLPGVWYFDCTTPASFICQSTAPPANEPMQGRAVYEAGGIAASQGHWPDPSLQWKVPLAVVLPLLAVVLLGMQVTRVYYRQMLRLPDIIRAQRKRALGPPGPGSRVSLVVTDIQGFSQLMREAPDSMAQALLLHNQVVRHAVYDHAGSVLEMEGDSFTVAFHDAEDAVAFTLQVQQALLQQNWPSGIAYHDSWEGATSFTNCHTASQHEQQRTSIESMLQVLGRDQSESEATAAAPDNVAADTNTTAAPVALRPANSGGLPLHLPWFQRSNVSAVDGGAGPSVVSMWEVPTGTSGAGSASSQAVGRRRNVWLQQLLSPHSQQPRLFAGLRVRMGVATGVVETAEIKNSPVYSTAQDVSTSALGGEVLLDEVTFRAIKESLWRLGTVTAAGYNYDVLYGAGTSYRSSRNGTSVVSSSRSSSSRPGSSRLWGSCLGSTRSGDNTLLSNHALVLDMGCYEMPKPTQHHDTYPTPAAAPASVSYPISTAASSPHMTGAIPILCPLWTDEPGARLVQQHQQFLQQQLQHQLQADADAPDSEGAAALSNSVSGDLDVLQFDVEQPPVLADPTSGAGHALRGWPFAAAPKKHGGGISNRQQRESGLGEVLLGLLGVSRHKASSAAHQADGLDSSTSSPWPSATAATLHSSAAIATYMSPPTIRIFQIVAPSLIPRAVLFGAQLNLPSHWRCLDPAYFAAPGLSGSSSNMEGGSSSSSSQANLQPVLGGVHGTYPRQVPHIQQQQQQQELADSHCGHLPLQESATMLGPDCNASPLREQLPPPTSPFAAVAAATSDTGDGVAAITRAAPAAATSSPQQAASLQSLPSAAALLRAASLTPMLTLSSSPRPAPSGSKSPGKATAGAAVIRPQYADVTIVFAMVEGAQQLVKYHGLSSSVHKMMHRLLLQLLRWFPGSYLVRAQAGDLKYMAAFTSPAAAAAWCVTVQEAALYMPYPTQLLGLNGFGLQLDAAGRLVFRGPRFKMGLCEGTPKCILPDFMGRADYHAPFVNQAARYADAAAHGGQVVADAETAHKIFQLWHVFSGNVSSSQAISASADTALSSSDVAEPQPAASAAVAVECSWLGSFVFKGNPRPVEMVCIAPGCLHGRSFPADAPSGKGFRVVQRVGAVDRAVLQLQGTLHTI